MLGTRDERGSVAPAWTAIITLVTVLLAALMINRVAWTAESINDKAESIKKTAANIQGDSAAVLNLDATNASASSILASAEPLDPKLRQIVGLAQAVDVKAKSINGSAGTISGTAKEINNTAGGIVPTASGINSTAADILSVAQSIMRGVNQINANLDGTIAIVSQVRGDTGNIRAAADLADTHAACIDAKLPLGQSLLTLVLPRAAFPQLREPDCHPT